jgi:hypothetical protein
MKMCLRNAPVTKKKGLAGWLDVELSDEGKSMEVSAELDDEEDLEDFEEVDA